MIFHNSSTIVTFIATILDTRISEVFFTFLLFVGGDTA
jgi:hypothetical protein